MPHVVELPRSKRFALIWSRTNADSDHQPHTEQRHGGNVPQHTTTALISCPCFRGTGISVFNLTTHIKSSKEKARGSENNQPLRVRDNPNTEQKGKLHNTQVIQFFYCEYTLFHFARRHKIEANIHKTL